MNEKNHIKWPGVVTEDVRRQVYKLKDQVFIINGQVKGKTLLPIPAGIESFESDKKQEAPKLVEAKVETVVPKLNQD